MKQIIVSGVIGLLMSLSPPAAAGVPTDQLKHTTDRVLQLVQDPALKAPGKTEVRRKEIRAVADEIFDWQATGRRALARHWQPLSAAQRAEFSTLFADLLERSYVGKIEAYTGEKIRYVGGDGGRRRGDGPHPARHPLQHRDPHRLPHGEGRRPVACV